MIINTIELNKILYCSKCEYVNILADNSICPNCNTYLEEIGFIENTDEGIVSKKGYTMGGSLVQGICGCGELNQRKGYDKNGKPRYRSQCTKCRYKALKQKGDKCNICGVKPEKRNLEVDHINGDRSDNDPKNIQTLCKPCHIKKTVENKDWRSKNAKALQEV